MNLFHAVEIINESDLYDKFNGKLREYWKRINYIQSGVTHFDKFGQNAIIIVNFFANISKSLNDPIQYDFRSLGEDEFLIINDIDNYCLK